METSAGIVFRFDIVHGILPASSISPRNSRGSSSRGSSVPTSSEQVSNNVVIKQVRCTEAQLDAIRGKSVELRQLIDRSRSRKEITLTSDPEVDIDCDVLAVVIENLQLDVAIADEKTTLVHMTTHCSALWKYKCDPRGFTDIGLRIDQAWRGKLALATPVNQGDQAMTRCWRYRSPHSDHNSLCFLNAAIVLGGRVPELKDCLYEEIKHVVWNSKAKLKTPVYVLQNIHGR